MSSVSKSGAFWFTWKVENFHLAPLKTNSHFLTPNFRVGLLQNTNWSLLLSPAGITDPLYIGCSLQREWSENEPEIVRLRWKVCVIAEGGNIRFETCIDSTFDHSKCEDVPCFIRKSELLPTDTPQNNLTIYCEMTNDARFSSELDLKYDLEALSSDLADLLESGFRSDFKMYCRGEIFNVHKFILLSRWPKFCKTFEMDTGISTRDDMIMTDIEPSTLKALLTLLYTGKLQRKDISMELCSYMNEKDCDILMRSLETPASNLEFVTYMHYEWKYLTWEVGDENAWKSITGSFFRVIPLEEIYPSEMVILFSFEKRNGDEWLKLSALFTGFMEAKPLLLDGEMSFKNKNAVVCSRKFHHLLISGEQWQFPQLVKKSDLFPNDRNSKHIEISLYICDGNTHARLVSANINNASSFKEVKDLGKLMTDLFKSSYKKDLKLKIDGLLYDVHSPVVAARSEKFRELIQQNGGILEIEGRLGKRAAVSFIRHLYGRRILDLDIESLNSLNVVAKEYSLTSLEENTRRMLEEKQLRS